MIFHRYLFVNTSFKAPLQDTKTKQKTHRLHDQNILFEKNFKEKPILNVVAHVCNPIFCEMKAEGLGFKDSLSHIVN